MPLKDKDEGVHHHMAQYTEQKFNKNK